MVLVHRDVYVNRMENILEDNIKLEKLDTKTRTLNFQVSYEKRINEILKNLKSAGSLTNKQYKKIEAVGSTFGVLYGLCKVHKAIVDVCPPFRPILSGTRTPTYKNAKFPVPIMSSLTINRFTFKDSFLFAKEIIGQDSSSSMGSLDVHVLPTFHLKKPLTSAQKEYMIKMILLKV